MRGNPSCLCLLAGTHRSIPACAGEPDNSNHYHPPCAVYPRVCGGTPVLLLLASSCSGLSPRVRGNPCKGISANCSRGSIPACAGEPACNSPRRPSRRVYPRVCGGTEPNPTIPVEITGLSPRVRGNRFDSFPVRPSSRSIPACAGEPRIALQLTNLLEVYPRVCGGTWTAYTHPWPGWGLSPRVRGNLLLQPATNRYCGSIPACAGEPSATCENPSAHAVYPRVCGGTELGTSQQPARPGLSPRVRGTSIMHIGHQHPPGLSPRVRGNQVRVPDIRAPDRSIPACAGEPSVCGSRM